jgi:hypothetical protein
MGENKKNDEEQTVAVGTIQVMCFTKKIIIMHFTTFHLHKRNHSLPDYLAKFINISMDTSHR